MMKWNAINSRGVSAVAFGAVRCIGAGRRWVLAGWLVPALAVAFVCVGGSVRGQNPQAELLKQVKFEPTLGAAIPREATFTDAEGQTVRFGDLLSDKPILLAPIYYNCPMLCSLTMEGLHRTLRTLDLEVGKDFDIVALSFDTREEAADAALSKTANVNSYERGRTGKGWHFLTGEEEQIRLVTDAIGFHYVFDEERNDYAHAAGLVLLTPEGQISRVLYGVEYQPRDLRLGLVEASGNRIGTPIDQALLLCYHYDPTTGKYGLAVINATRAGGVLTVGALVGGMAIMLRNERRRNRRNEGGSGEAIAGASPEPGASPASEQNSDDETNREV